MMQKLIPLKGRIFINEALYNVVLLTDKKDLLRQVFFYFEWVQIYNFLSATIKRKQCFYVL